VKPRLLPDINFLPTDDGVSVRAPGHEAALHAPGLYPWFERVCPFLDGEHSVVDLVQKLSPPTAQRVLGLVEFLLREGFARDAEFDLPHTLSPAVRGLHAGMIEYLARAADSPERRFQQYRECAPVAVGSGRLLESAAVALLASGVEHVRVRVVPAGPDGETATDLASVAECAAALLHRDQAARLEFEEGEPEDLPADAGALLYLSDRPDHRREARLRSLASCKGLRYGYAFADADRVLISEVEVPRTPSGATAGERGSLTRPGEPSRLFGGPGAALAANRLCLHLLRHTAGLVELDAEPVPGVRELDLATAGFDIR